MKRVVFIRQTMSTDVARVVAAVYGFWRYPASEMVGGPTANMYMHTATMYTHIQTDHNNH